MSKKIKQKRDLAKRRTGWYYFRQMPIGMAADDFKGKSILARKNKAVYKYLVSQLEKNPVIKQKWEENLFDEDYPSDYKFCELHNRKPDYWLSDMREEPLKTDTLAKSLFTINFLRYWYVVTLEGEALYASWTSSEWENEHAKELTKAIQEALSSPWPKIWKGI